MTEIKSLLPRWQGVTDGVADEVNTQRKDGDPRKINHILCLLLRHPKAIRIWEEFGIMRPTVILDTEQAQREAGWGHSVRRIVMFEAEKNGSSPTDRPSQEVYSRRMHFAPEHMVTVAIGAEALGKLLVEKGHLQTNDVEEVVTAALVHDAGKELEHELVGAALNGPVTRESFSSVMKKSVHENTDPPTEAKIESAFNNYHQSLKKSSPGVRGLAAYDLAGEINTIRLSAAGVNPETIKLQKMVGHASCPETERLVNSFEGLSPEEKRKTLQVFVLHYLDDIVTNPNIIDPTVTQEENALDRRCSQNETNSRYINYNQAWRTDPCNTTSETAY